MELLWGLRRRAFALALVVAARTHPSSSSSSSSSTIAFEAPVLVAESSSARPEHAWFPEGGAVVGHPSTHQAVLVAVWNARRPPDGGAAHRAQG